MSIFDRKNARREYVAELVRQTAPYRYFIEHNEKEARGILSGSPLVCALNPLRETETHRVYECGGFNIYENKKGSSSTEEKQLLLADQEKLNYGLIYCDEDCINSEGARNTPFFKPEWAPTTYVSLNYIDGLFAVREDLDAEDESIDDKISRIAGIGALVTHVPLVLYHVLSNKSGEDYYAEYIAGYKPPAYTDQSGRSLSVIIPSKDNPDLLGRCFAGLREAKIKSGINDFEIVLIDNGSSDENKEKITDVIKEYSDLSPAYYYDTTEFNYSMMCNVGVDRSRGDYFLFLNDDIEVIDKDFLTKMLYFASMPHIGAVGPKLYYPGGDKLQHTGVTFLPLCGPSHKLTGFSDSRIYYFGRNRINSNSLALTGACLMVSREKYFLTGGFHDKMKVGYNDTDLCVSLYERGYYNVIVNDTVLFHHESVTRGVDAADPGKLLRLKAERQLFYDRHPWLLINGDPFYSPNLIQDTLEYRVNVVADCESRIYRSEITELKDAPWQAKFRGLTAHPDDNARIRLESARIERAIYDEGDAYVLEGWAILLHKDNALMYGWLCIMPKDGDPLFASMTPKLRTDVREVFSGTRGTKNLELSGFVCKIPTDRVKIGPDCKMGFLAKDILGGFHFAFVE